MHLKFDIQKSNLSDFAKKTLLKLNDQRISKDGIIVIRVKKYNTKEKNKEEAINQLKSLISRTMAAPNENHQHY